jgi:hypothetical protein
MKPKSASALPILLFFILVGICLAAGPSMGQPDDKASHPPSDGSAPGDHGGGDPDNPVPVGAGDDPQSFRGGGIQAFAIPIGTGEGSSIGGDLLRLMSTLTGVIDSVLFL